MIAQEHICDMIDQGLHPTSSLAAVLGGKELHLYRDKPCHSQSLGPFIYQYRLLVRFPLRPVKTEGHFQRWLMDSRYLSGLPKFGWGRAVHVMAPDQLETKIPRSIT